MKILFVTHHFARSNANTFRYRNLAQELSKLGYSIDIIGDRSLTDYQLPHNCRYFSLLKDVKSIDIFPIIWWTIVEFFKLYPLWFFLKNKYLAYTILICGAAKYRIRKQLNLHQYDAILLSITPWTYHTFSKYLSKHSPLIVDLGDPLYKNAFLDKNPSGSERLKRFEYNSLKYASYLPIMSEPLKSIYVDDMKLSSSKVEFISPAANIDNYKRGESFLYSIDNSEPLHILYAGMLYPKYRDLEQIAPAFSSTDNVKLTVITNNKIQLCKNVNKLSWVVQTDLKKLYKEVDILLFIDNFYGYQIPSKIFELLAESKPILFVYDKRNTYLYEKLKAQKGIFFVENETQQIRKTIEYLKLLDNIEVKYDIDLTEYSETYITNKLVKVINNVQR